VSFTLEAGETLAVVGYNGSGEFPLPPPPFFFSFLPPVLLTFPLNQIKHKKNQYTKFKH